MQPTDWETDIVLIVSYSTDAGAMISPLRFGMEGGMGALALLAEKEDSAFLSAEKLCGVSWGVQIKTRLPFYSNYTQIPIS